MRDSLLKRSFGLGSHGKRSVLGGNAQLREKSIGAIREKYDIKIISHASSEVL